MSLTGNSHPFVTRGSHVSRAPPHHTLPAFVNLHGSYLDDEDWNSSKAKMFFKNGILNVQSVQSYNGIELSCKLVSSARILHWIALDSHRAQNLKPCHEYVGKPVCKTCPE